MGLCLLVVTLALCLLAANSVEGTTINYVRDEGHDFKTLIKNAKGNFDKNSIQSWLRLHVLLASVCS